MHRKAAMPTRFMRMFTATTLLATVAAVALGAAPAQAATVTYSADLATAFANPERGYHNRYEIINDPAVNDYVNAATIPGFNPDLLDRTFARAKANGNTLVHSYLHLDKYKTQALPQALLDNLASGLAAVRTAGMKIVLRPAYTWDGYASVAESQILAHIAQINAVIAANADVVLHLETGYLGAWGEWHTGTLTNSSSVEEAPARYRIVKKIADTTPASIPLAMRYPIYIKEMIDPTSCVVPEGCGLTQAQKDRISFHNDCFLADVNDMGTYDNPSWMGWYYIEQKKQWMYDGRRGDLRLRRLQRRRLRQRADRDEQAQLHRDQRGLRGRQHRQVEGRQPRRERQRPGRDVLHPHQAQDGVSPEAARRHLPDRRGPRRQPGADRAPGQRRLVRPDQAPHRLPGARQRRQPLQPAAEQRRPAQLAGRGEHRHRECHRARRRGGGQLQAGAVAAGPDGGAAFPAGVLDPARQHRHLGRGQGLQRARVLGHRGLLHR
jgi:hypothetical protein